MARWLLIGLAALVVGVLLACGGLLWLGNSLFGALCGNEIVKEVASPSGAYRAVVFQRDCGATTAYSTQVSVLRAGEPLPERAGNVLVVADLPDDVAVEVVWDGDRSVTLAYFPGGQVRYRADSVRLLFTVIEVRHRPR